MNRFKAYATSSFFNMNLTSDLLQFLSEQDNMELLQELQQKMIMSERKKLLAQHCFTIWENGDYCYTYLPDKAKKHGRRQVKRKSNGKDTARKVIEDLIVDFYKNTQNDQKNLRDVFLEWSKYKANHTDSTSYMKRIAVDWNKFYEKDPISEIPVKQLTELYLDNWIHLIIKKHKLNKKQYYNMSIILRQGLDYAVRHMKLIDENPFMNVVINKKMLRDNPRKSSESQVFSIDEEPMIIEYEQKKFSETDYTIHLGVILLFSLGLRVGEICALKTSDFNRDYSYVNIHAMEIVNYETDDGIHYRTSGREVVDHAKTDCGTRKIYVRKDARNIVKQIIRHNKTNGHWDKDDWLFLRGDERTPSYCFQNALLKACVNLKLPKRSIHKIRKTYISALIDGNINITEVMQMAGHSDQRTTLNNYCFNRYSKEQTENQIENALAL